MPLKFRTLKPTTPLIATAKIERELAHELNGFVAAVEDAMATYPPKSPASRYRRTMTLARSWSIIPAKRVGGALVATVGSNANIAPYNEQVQGDGQLPTFKRLGWRKVEDVVNKLWPKYRANIVAIIEAAGSSR